MDRYDNIQDDTEKKQQQKNGEVRRMIQRDERVRIEYTRDKERLKKIVEYKSLETDR